MKKKRFIFYIFCIGIILGISNSVNAQNTLSKKDSEAIRTIKETYRKAWLKDDSETILSLFADEAVIYPNGLAPQIGKKALRDFWFGSGDYKTVITEYRIDLDEIYGEQNLAYATGATGIEWTMTEKKTGETKKYASTGNFMTVFVKRNNQWKIIKHIWNGRFEEVKE